MIKLVDVLKKPELLATLSPNALSNIVAESRYFNMLAQLRVEVDGLVQCETLPEKLHNHIRAAYYAFENQQLHLKFEAEEFEAIFSELNIQWVYLKGGAYLLAEFEEFNGRLMSDIDILVPESAIPDVEHLLLSHGWIHTHVSDYDEKYYREWSQEIPPMRHIERQTELDLHFNILPKTLKEAPDTNHLMREITSLRYSTNGYILNPAAMVIHSAVHLFYESDYIKGLRDLYDLHLLLTRFSKQEGFWSDLVALQETLTHGRPVFYALRYCELLFDHQVPKYVTDFYAQYEPSSIKLKVADFAFIRVFAHMYPPNRLRGHKMAQALLYLRGHIKRMPLYLLIPHLVRKTVYNLFHKDDPLD